MQRIFVLHSCRSIVSFISHLTPQRPRFWIIASLLFSSSFSRSLARRIPSHSFVTVDHSILRRLSHTLAMTKLESPSAQRNKEPIWEVLFSNVLPLLRDVANDDILNILEVAAGAGVHTDHFARKLITNNNNKFLWFPTDPQELSRASIQTYISDSILINQVRDPLPLTFDENGIMESHTASQLPKLDLVICINMIHISPWQATIGLMKTAAETLRTGGVLYCYGPYKENGTAVESNLYVPSCFVFASSQSLVSLTIHCFLLFLGVCVIQEF